MPHQTLNVRGQYNAHVEDGLSYLVNVSVSETDANNRDGSVGGWNVH